MCLYYPNQKPKEDKWAFQFQSIGDPFPPNPAKIPGAQNMHVALWYKHGKPIYGCARNNGGVVECSFAYETIELKDPKDVGGKIQVLQYIDDHRTQGFWYNWIPYKERLDKQASERQLMKTGASMSLLWKKGPRDTPLLGYLDTSTGIGWFAQDGKAIQVTGKPLDDMLIIVRELRGGPPNCTCPECPPKER